jgi:hypothetical protein
VRPLARLLLPESSPPDLLHRISSHPHRIFSLPKFSSERPPLPDDLLRRTSSSSDRRASSNRVDFRVDLPGR